VLVIACRFKSGLRYHKIPNLGVIRRIHLFQTTSGASDSVPVPKVPKIMASGTI
jgi:hypothetical protein